MKENPAWTSSRTPIRSDSCLPSVSALSVRHQHDLSSVSGRRCWSCLQVKPDSFPLTKTENQGTINPIVNQPCPLHSLINGGGGISCNQFLPKAASMTCRAHSPDTHSLKDHQSFTLHATHACRIATCKIICVTTSVAKDEQSFAVTSVCGKKN